MTPTLYVCGHCGGTFTSRSTRTGCPDCHDGHPDATPYGTVDETGTGLADVTRWAVERCGECGPPFPRHRPCAHTVPSPATLAYLKAWGLVA